MANPYQSPSTESALKESPITNEIVRQLIDGDDVETFFFSDVSDDQLYGCKHFRKLTGSLADAAEEAGCEAKVYQAVHWWCLVFMPIVPLGVYFVIPRNECDDPDLNDADQYRGIRTDWDRNQIAFHYGVLLLVILVAGLVILVLW